MSASAEKPIFGGVCYTLGKKFGIPAWVLRATFVLVALGLGTGLLLYIVLWIFMPKAS